MRAPRAVRRLAAIMMAEIAGYGRLMEANEEATVNALLRHHREFLDPTIAWYGGRIFKDMGEAFLVEFPSAVESVQCAVDLQSGMIERNEGLPLDRHIMLRLGINLADVVVDGEDLHGDDVNTSARLSALAVPGAIICSEGIRHQVGSKLDIAFVDHGEKEVKNILYPIHVYGVAPARLQQMERMRIRDVDDRDSTPGQLSVAVLPFTNIGNDPAQAYLSDGMAEDILTELSKVSGFFVLSRNAVFKYRDQSLDMGKVARELGVSHLVHGSVRRSANRARVAAELIEGTSGRSLWGERYDRELSDIFALQDEISRAIVAQLKHKLLPIESENTVRAPTANVEAYTRYLRGREFFYRGTKSDYIKAKQMFAAAIELDPGYAKAYAGLADCDAFLYMDYNEDLVAEVLKNSEQALSLEPDLKEALASHGLALSISHRFDEAEWALKRALELDPDHFETRFFFGRSCYMQGRLDETAMHWERAAEVKPDDYQSLILLNQVFTSLGRPQEAVRSSKRGVERAKREFERNPSNPRPAYFIATALAKLGEDKQAEEWAKKAMEIAPDDFLTLYNVACFYSVSGKPDLAFEILLNLSSRSNAETKKWIMTDSDLKPLHRDRRWKVVQELLLSS